MDKSTKCGKNGLKWPKMANFPIFGHFGSFLPHFVDLSTLHAAVENFLTVQKLCYELQKRSSEIYLSIAPTLMVVRYWTFTTKKQS